MRLIGLAALLVPFGCGEPTLACGDFDRDGYAACGANPDCNDRRADVFPGARELCDGLDNNCNGAPLDEELDADDDGAFTCDGDCDDGDPASNLSDWDGDGWTTCEGDCDDLAFLVYPGATEICDGIDGDCDQAVDDELPMLTWYRDADRDGWGADEPPVESCSRPSSLDVERSGDCDDGDSAIHPLADEVCDGIDNDCDEVVDPECAP